MHFETGRGRESDYRFGTPRFGWSGLLVVRFRGIERISQPFEYDIVLMRRHPEGLEVLTAPDTADQPVDIDQLVDAPATLAMYTGAAHAREGARAWRRIHGIVAEAEEIDRGPHYHLYLVKLVPHFARARHRRRSRNFVDRTLKSVEGKEHKGIVDLVLTDAPTGSESPGPHGLTDVARQRLAAPSGVTPEGEYTPPSTFYRWALADTSRVESPRVRPYVVQYGETDFDFASRLLEEEGISYVFEEVEAGVVMTLTDQPSTAALHPHALHLEYKSWQGGDAASSASVRTFRWRRRLRPRQVTMRDYYWHKPQLEYQLTARPQGIDDARGLEHFEYPGREGEAEYQADNLLAAVNVERFEADRNLSSGTGNARAMAAGGVVHISNIVREGGRDGDLLIVGVESVGVEMAPEGPVLSAEPFRLEDHGRAAPYYENRFEVLEVTVPFRPPRATRKPRIDGVETAVVTAEDLAGEREGPRHQTEVNCDEHGRVRVRFPWDQKPVDGSKTSMWIRVSNQWAGPGFGGLYTPRVGHEVLVAYHLGDPERPVIVGRVYNGTNLPPAHPVDRHRLRSTIRSDSSDNHRDHRTEGFNELRFEDRLHHELVYLHAQRDLTEEVHVDHSTHVGHDQCNTVDHDQFNHVKNNRKHTVDGEELVTVRLDRGTQLLQNERHYVEYTRRTEIGVAEMFQVHGPRDEVVDQDDSRTVHGSEQLTVNRSRFVTVAQNHNVVTRGYFTQETTNNHVQNTGADFWHTTTGDDHFTAGNTYFRARHFQVDANTMSLWVRQRIEIHVGAAVITLTPGRIHLTTGAAEAELNGDRIKLTTSGPVEVASTGGATDIKGATVTVHATSGDATVRGASVKLNP